MDILKFAGEHRFLSNFWHCRVLLDDQVFQSVEHAYQAAKTLNRNERIAIALCETPGDAKRMGKRITKRPDWDKIKWSIMDGLVRQKFCNDEDLKTMLINTEDEHLEEGNFWGDTFWGTCNGVGENHLGKLIMKIRGELIESSNG